MKKFVFLLSLTLVGLTALCQDLLFTSEFGGQNSNGAIVKVNPATGASSVFTSLGGNPFTASMPTNADTYYQYLKGGLTLGTDGKYYGVAFLPSGITNLDLTKKTDRGILDCMTSGRASHPGPQPAPTAHHHPIDVQHDGIVKNSFY